jgi:hypothetical protein
MATLPRPTRSWAITPNAVNIAAQANAGITNQRVMRLLLAAGVTAGAWTLDYSCNAVTAGVKGDGVNRWFIDGDIVNNSFAVVTLVGGGQILLHRDGATDGAGSVYWSESVGFTGGTTVARPTASDEQEISQTANWLSTTNGAHTVHLWVSTEAGKQGVRIAVVNAAVVAGPVLLASVERARTEVAAWVTPNIARWMGGASTFGNRSDWNATAGWQARVGGTVRQMLLEGLTPQVAVDPDGDRLVEPSGITNGTIGDVGWVDDFFTVDDGVTNLATFSDPDGARGWVVFDEIVWPWDHTTDLGVANIAGAKLRQIYLPSDAACELVSTTPTAGDPLGADFDAARWQSITAVFLLPDGGFLPTARVVMDGHAIWHTAFDGAAWSPLFEPNSSVQINGREVTMTLLPIGGWWGAPTIKFGAFMEAT